ncbi:MAG: excalibur calcium-binding domain-containing protein [Anaerolineae bacterium]|nr:excalibur calcium-binding domain-containing protein [Anaerolineae bacterium]
MGVNSTPVIIPTAGAGETICDCNRSNAYNCSNFRTHAEAQTCYETCLAVTGRDVHGLDRDKDGRACETLP